MLEKLLFNMFAFSFFIIIFFKIIRRNDTNYFIALVLEAIGITISFIVLKLGLNETAFWCFLRYILSIVIPIIIIGLEFFGINFSELMSICASQIALLFKDNKKAKEILVKLVSKYPNSYLGHKLLAQMYEKEGGMRRAIEEYVTAVDINKQDYKSYFKITELLKNLGKRDEAIEMLQHLIRIKPDCFEGSCLLADLLCEEERFKEAANVYNEALIYNPSSYDLYYNLGIVYTRLSDFQLAKEMYDKAAAINHKMYGANYNLGLIAFIQRDYDSAERYFEKSLYDDFEAMSYYQLAKICITKGEKDKAIIFLNKAIELEPSLLKLVEKEKCFKSIRENITVSVKLDGKEVEEEVVQQDDDDKPFEYEDYSNGYKRNSIILEQERLAREYLESSAELIEEMSQNTSKTSIDNRLDYLFSKEKTLSFAEQEKIEQERKERERIEREKAQKEEKERQEFLQNYFHRREVEDSKKNKDNLQRQKNIEDNK